jgi:protein TonB
MRTQTIETQINKTAPSKLRRFAVATGPAIAITTALFVAMQIAVEVEDVSPREMRVYDLVKFTPIEIDPPRIIDDRAMRRQAPVTPPPKAPPLVKKINLIDVPAGDYGGAIPADYGAADLESIKPARATSVIDRVFLPISPPVPVYPPRAIKRGLEGECNVYLSVSTRGDPFDVRAVCSDKVFESAAKKAVQKVKFAPKIHDGLPVTVTGVVYPLEFRMER